METNNNANLIFNKMMQNDFCSQWLNIKLVKIKEGYCEINMIVRKEMLNGFGILHGGIAYTFADSAFAFASNSYGRLSVSINGSMNFLKSAKENDLLSAKAKVINLTYKTADFDVEITNAKTNEKLYLFRGTVYRKSENVLDL